MTRPSKRKNSEIRDVEISLGTLVHSKNSCLIKIGNTHVICSATIEETLPPFLRNKGQGGWVTAEYNMIPGCSAQRVRREISQGKPSGRTQEIQRLIGRSLRSVVDLMALGERQITIDCDVINADGGTRTASITGGYVALHLAMRSLVQRRLVKTNPLREQVAAISCGIYNGHVVADLDYAEDSTAEIDGNFVFTASGSIVEAQASAEAKPCSTEEFHAMIELAQDATKKLFAEQNKVLLNL